LACLNQQTINGQAGFVPKGSEEFCSIWHFHISKNIKITFQKNDTESEADATRPSLQNRWDPYLADDGGSGLSNRLVKRHLLITRA
jgi:hypothetical protein